MSVSGSSAWNPTVLQMITNAYQQLGVIAEDETPTPAMYASGLMQINSIVAAAQATGLHVWTEQEAILFLQSGLTRYEIGGPGENANTSDATTWHELTLTASASAAATAITVTANTDVTIADQIGVILDDGTTFWTTVSALPSSTVVDLTDALPSSASSGNYALTYTTAIVRPLKVPNARLLQLNGYNETPMQVMSRQEYMDTPNKYALGTPTQWFYTPQQDRGILYVWPAPFACAWAIRFTWYRPLQDYFNPGDTSDFPQEWIAPLMWTLAKDLMGIFDTPPMRQAYIKEQAQVYGDLAVNYDRESEPIQFGMDWQFSQGA